MKNLRSGFPILMTESTKPFASRRKALHKEIKPSSLIERELVDDFAAITWDIPRLRRLRSEIINGAISEALENILKQLLRRADYETDYEHQRRGRSRPPMVRRQRG